MRSLKYKMQAIEQPIIEVNSIPGITTPQTNYGVSIGGSEAPEANATEGATAGTNLKDSGLNTLEDTHVKNIGTLIAGETINGATVPVPVYLNTTDNEIYACDANDGDTMKFIGFAISNGTAGNPIKVQFIGIVPNFSSLSVGQVYFVQDAVGTIGTLRGTYPLQVGIAVSATELAIIPSDKGDIFQLITSDTLAHSNDAEATTNNTSYTKVKETIIRFSGTIRVKFDLKNVNDAGDFSRGKIYVNGVAVGTERQNSTSSYITYSEDISVNEDDEIQIYAMSSHGSIVSYVRNLRLYYNKVPKLEAETIS